MSHLTYMHAISILFVFCVLTIAKLFNMYIAKNYEGVRELKITMTLAPSGKTSGETSGQKDLWKDFQVRKLKTLSGLA